MTDYYSFIVGELHGGADESRSQVYVRVREELVAKLHRPALRIPEFEVAGELRAFDAAVRRIEAEIARGQSLETGAPASKASRTSSVSTRSIPITSTEVEPLETNQTEVEADQISRVREVELAPPARTANADLDLQRQMLQAIGTALDLAAHPRQSADATGKERTQSQSLKAGFPSVAEARTVRKQLTHMMVAIVIFCAVFAVIYFAVDVGKWIGF
jgi:hypothetical protein